MGGTNFSSLGWGKKGEEPKFSQNPSGEPKPYILWLETRKCWYCANILTLGIGNFHLHQSLQEGQQQHDGKYVAVAAKTIDYSIFESI